MSTQWRPWITAPRFMPLFGVLIGAAAGGIYWLGAQVWPTSIAVVLSMLATELLSAGIDSPAGTGARAAADGSFGSVGFVFAVLVKYNALMALSAASLPFALPANLALGLIMIAGQASSRALAVSVLASPARASPAGLASPARRAWTPTSHGDVAIALAIGFAPAALIGIPGLIGLAAAIVARIAFAAYVRRRRPSVTAAEFGMTQQLTEICFYLGALGSWAYI
jgi:adenosylcobinamide-GDP ribazoletransferase